MKDFFDYLSSIKITSAPDAFDVLASVLRQSGFDAIRDIASQCYVLSEAGSNYPKDALKSVFKFSVNGSVSGGIRPCAEIGCRINNLQDLSAFAALYAERVYIPNPFEHVYEHLNHNFEFPSAEAKIAFVDRIAGDIAVMFNLKPLIEHDIVRINPQVRAFCDEHWEHHILEAKKFQRKMEELDPMLIRALNAHVRFELRKDKTILLREPQKYTNVEILSFFKFPENLIPYLSRAPYTFTADEVERLGMWQAIIIPTVNEVIFQKYSVFKQDAAYLTSYGLEREVIEGLNSKTDENRSKELFDALTHELPFVSNVTTDSLVRLRLQENESFQVYRDNLSSVIRDLSDGSITPSQARDVVQSEINPHLHKVDQLIRVHSDSLNARATGMVIFDAALIMSAGIFGNWADISKIGGFYTARNILSTIFGARMKPEAALNDNYFFLWSVRERSARR